MPTGMPFSLAALQDAIAGTDPAPVTPPVSSSASHGSALWPMVAAASGNAADVLTTMDALHRGARESNPLLPGNSIGIAAIKGALTVPELIAIHHLNASGHPTAAKVMGYLIGGTGAGLALHNSTVSDR